MVHTSVILRKDKQKPRKKQISNKSQTNQSIKSNNHEPLENLHMYDTSDDDYYFSTFYSYLLVWHLKHQILLQFL